MLFSIIFEFFMMNKIIACMMSVLTFFFETWKTEVLGYLSNKFTNYLMNKQFCINKKNINNFASQRLVF